MKLPVICVIGLPQAGKTTLCRFLSAASGRRHGTCSSLIYPILASLRDDLEPGDWHVQVPEHKHAEVRAELVKLGNAVSDNMPSVYPIALHMQGCTIIDGVRRRAELDEFRAYCEAALIPLHVVWVDRLGYASVISDNTELTSLDSDCVIRARTVEDLKESADLLLDGVAAMTGKPAAEELVFKTLEAGFSETSRIVHATAREKGWWDTDKNDGEALCLIHSEVSEALEALRHGNPPDDKIPEFSGVEAELADVVIRIMDMAAARGWRVGEAITAKVKYNKTRAYKHGGKKF